MTKLVSTLVSLLFFLGCKEGQKNELSTNSEEIISSEMESKTSEIKIIPIEHASAVIEWKEITIYIDPTGGGIAYEGQRKPDIILITDIHGDHFNPETLEEFGLSNTTIIVPQAVAEKMTEKIASKIHVLNNGESIELNSIVVEAIPMYNLREEALQFHVKGRGNGYLINLGGERIYFSGDTEDIPEMRALKNIDKAFVCMNLPYTMPVESAADAVLEFKPKQVYPYHFRGNPNVGDVKKFKAIVNSGNADIEVVQLDWYPKEDY